MLDKINNLMKKLSTVKGCALLKKVSHLSAVVRNGTRWSSTANIVARYTALMGPIGDLDHASIERHELAPLLLSADENDAIHALHSDMSNLEEVTKLLQD
ncbi:TPA: hypothetical protein N0F65_012120 [Lagenidium giganteum]|uniref:Uncharacterized protein n=1 Tax=Lagenidium giganteum TaxID=4803 RepID=A0AAV2YLX2_9STRA|nr:TPA: hypothetical protein N0F65_012120 [Lagenidium giganteum]